MRICVLYAFFMKPYYLYGKLIVLSHTYISSIYRPAHLVRTLEQLTLLD